MGLYWQGQRARKRPKYGRFKRVLPCWPRGGGRWPNQTRISGKCVANRSYQSLKHCAGCLQAVEKPVFKCCAIALYLNLPEDYFDAKVKHGNSILRPIHYFPIENPDAVPADAVRAAEHGDINLITLLMGQCRWIASIKARWQVDSHYRIARATWWWTWVICWNATPTKIKVNHTPRG